LGPDALDSIAVGLGGFNYMRSCRLGVPHA